MIKVEKIDVWGFEHAIRGMRNPMNSWDKSDTLLCGNVDNPDLILGKKGSIISGNTITKNIDIINK